MIFLKRSFSTSNLYLNPCIVSIGLLLLSIIILVNALAVPPKPTIFLKSFLY